MKNNYPIKYALMPIYEQVGWSHGLNELERNYDIVAYIVSKCYVLSEIKKYSTDGSFSTNYEVVFVYEKVVSNHIDWVRAEPEFGYGDKSTNSIIVNNIFNSYSEALREADVMNKKILDKKIASLPYSEDLVQKIDKLQTDYEKLIEKYKNLEVMIEKNTFDLKDGLPKEQSIIARFNDEDKILNLSIYDFINLYKYEPFYVCNVSKEDYDLMKNQIKNNEMLDERSATKSLKLNYDRFRYLLANDIKNNMIRIVNCDSEKEQGCFYLSNDNMYYDETMYKFYKDPVFARTICGIKVYTTENYSDIIKSYIPRYVDKTESKIEIDNKFIRKTLKLKQ